jgi:hypothetical protein
MKPNRLAVLVSGIPICFAFYGCESFTIVEKSRDVVLPRAEYEQLESLAMQPSQVGRYQLHHEGSRTWRLDTATGRTCLMLTSEADWQKDTPQLFSCVADDSVAATERHNLYPATYDQQGRPMLQVFNLGQSK